MAIVLLIPDKPNVKNLITERGQPSPFENYTYSKTFEANTSFILFFLLFNVLSLVKHAIDYCGFQWVSVFSRLSPSLSGVRSSKAYLLDTQWRAKIFQTPVSVLIFGTFLHNQLPIPDSDLRMSLLPSMATQFSCFSLWPWPLLTHWRLSVRLCSEGKY